MAKLNSSWPLYRLLKEDEQARCTMQAKGCTHWAVVIYIPTHDPLCESCKAENDRIRWSKGLK